MTWKTCISDNQEKIGRLFLEYFSLSTNAKDPTQNLLMKVS